MKKPNVPVVIVAAMSRKNRVVGKENKLLWHVPEDLKHFKSLTLGHPVIMGRKTFESIVQILGKPLPGRTNIIVTRNSDYQHEGVKTATSLEKAFTIAQEENPTEIHIGGGEEIWRLSFPYVDRLHLTFFDDEPEGDAYFPDFTQDFVEIKKHPPQEYGELRYQWVDFKRKP
ncbi:MAG: dihydrofolate reductase [Candidatus Nomurabacteria bacterium]|nr:dihydrofolate reductase [Candidatus Nomurabacteria bacterium]USN88218.1 MAG: dihydrofolate reductase [Candidatus Nomurabacteria bacterium]